jgi:hypothetical protein
MFKTGLPRKLPVICLPLLLVMLTSAFLSESRAQSVPESDPDLVITTVELPKGTSSVWGPFGLVVGDGTVWFHHKDQLFKFEKQNGHFMATPIEQEKKAPFATFAAGGGSIWLFGQAHGVEGVHRIDPVTGQCVATIALKLGKGLNVFAYGEGALWMGWPCTGRVSEGTI